MPLHPHEQATLCAATCYCSCCYVCLELARWHFIVTRLSISPCFSLRGATCHNSNFNLSTHVLSYHFNAYYLLRQGHTLKHKPKKQRLRPFKGFFWRNPVHDILQIPWKKLRHLFLAPLVLQQVAQRAWSVLFHGKTHPCGPNGTISFAGNEWVKIFVQIFFYSTYWQNGPSDAGTSVRLTVSCFSADAW